MNGLCGDHWLTFKYTTNEIQSVTTKKNIHNKKHYAKINSFKKKIIEPIRQVELFDLL